jgi:ribosome-binding factor A
MKSFRPQRVAHVVRAVVSEAIAHKLNDPRIDPLSSVTRVEVSGDLEHAKVFVSVMGEPAVQRRTMKGLLSAAGHVQTMVARELPIRHCPHLSFHLDASLKETARTLRLIEETMAEYRDREEEPEQHLMEPDRGEGPSVGEGE